jgi:hypothetical protein
VEQEEQAELQGQVMAAMAAAALVDIVVVGVTEAQVRAPPQVRVREAVAVVAEEDHLVSLAARVAAVQVFWAKAQTAQPVGLVRAVAAVQGEALEARRVLDLLLVISALPAAAVMVAAAAEITCITCTPLTVAPALCALCGPVLRVHSHQLVLDHLNFGHANESLY